MLVYAYERGGATTAGLVAVAQLVPAGAVRAVRRRSLADRHPPGRVLRSATSRRRSRWARPLRRCSRTAPPLVAYALAAVAATAVTVTRPTQAALVPGARAHARRADRGQRRLRLDRERQRARRAGADRRAARRRRRRAGCSPYGRSSSRPSALARRAACTGPAPAGDALPAAARRRSPASACWHASRRRALLVGLLGGAVRRDRRARRALRRARDRACSTSAARAPAT